MKGGGGNVPVCPPMSPNVPMCPRDIGGRLKRRGVTNGPGNTRALTPLLRRGLCSAVVNRLLLHSLIRLDGSNQHLG